MTVHTPLAAHVRLASEVKNALVTAGLDETDEDFATIFANETDDIHERLRRMIRAARWAESQAKAVKEMEADLKDRRTRFEAKAEQIRAVVQWALGELGEDKLAAPDFSASVRAGTPSVVITDELALPDEFVRIKREPDKTALKEALKAGTTVVGAEMSNGRPSLQIRFK